MSTALDRVPPQNLEAEQSVIGSMLIDREAIVKAMEYLQPHDFYREANRHIFEVLTDLFESGEAVDIITVTEELKKRKRLEEVGGPAYLATLANFVPTAANVVHYARIVEEKSLLRQLIAAATQIVGRSFQDTEEIGELIDDAERLIFQISQKRNTQSYVSIKDVLLDTFEHIEYLYTKKGGVTGVPTGYPDLDQLTSGFQASDLIIIAARPSQGKTTLVLNMCRNAAALHSVPVAIFSLEMAREQLALRLLCSEAGVDMQRLRTGQLRQTDWKPLSTAMGKLADAPIFIDDTPNIPVMEMRAKARRIKSEHGLGLIVVDYLQLMQTRGRSENRQQEISEISRSLKALARELDCPVVACSQLSRAIEQRTDRRPMLSDLRESGAIEQDADVVAFIHQDKDAADPNLVELIIAKQRNGPVGSVELYFRKDVGRFESVERRYQAG
ncbi:MAG: replicative DNA helicase [Bacillota bacterium]